MKLDATDLRFLSADEFRVLTAVEMGSKNHEVVPSSLIASISGLRSGGVMKCLGDLSKRKLVARVQGAKCACRLYISSYLPGARTDDGFRLTYGGYDYLAIRALAKRDSVHSVGNQIGTGKESDIYVVADEEGLQSVLKIHRLGRISFRTIKSKRDYLRKGQSASWMYMSRLAAMKEYAFMKVLHEHGFPVPKPVDQARHCLVMELIDAFPLRQVSEIADPGALYSQLMDLIVRLARSGLIHGDFNEFNILLTEEGKPVLIDFPQMVSTDHENAEYYFNRDVECIRTFFKRRFRYESSTYPRFRAAIEGERDFRLDVEVEASGWTNKEARALSEYMEQVANEEQSGEEGSGSGSGSGSQEEGEEVDEEESEGEEGEVEGQDHDRHSDSPEDAEPPDEEEPPAVETLSLHQPRDISAKVAAEQAKRKAAQARRHHGKKAPQSAGKRKGSKAKGGAGLDDGW